jgi:hypothetical protein
MTIDSFGLLRRAQIPDVPMWIYVRLMLEPHFIDDMWKSGSRVLKAPWWPHDLN